MKTISYWLDTAPPAPDRSGRELDTRTDVAVVGAGLTGLSTAIHLARKGARVTVLEKETVGWGASGRNGGMCTTGLAIGFRTAVERYGVPAAKAMYLSYNEAIDTVEKLVTEEGIDAHFARTGKLNLADWTLLWTDTLVRIPRVVARQDGKVVGRKTLPWPASPGRVRSGGFTCRVASVGVGRR